MSVDHHLDDVTLWRYASGGLDEVFTTVVATHLAMCETCREAARQAEEVGGNLLSEAAQTDLSIGAFDRLMDKLDTPEVEHSYEMEPAFADNNVNSDVPLPLRRLIGDELDAVKWKFVAPGVRKYDIKKVDSRESDLKSSLYMLKIAPGMKVPEHGHGGSELTLIMSGCYEDVFGQFKRGDIADLDEHVEHQPIVRGDEPCICLVATEAPTRFKDVITRVLQPLIGI